MSSSVAMSIRKSGPRVIRPASSQLVATHTSNRSIWRCARDGQGDKAGHISRNLNKYQRYPIYNQRKPEIRNDTHSTRSWAAWRSQSRFSELPAELEIRLWNSDLGQMHKRMEVLKKYIEADPYRAVFGRGLNPFQNFRKNDTSLNDVFLPLSSMEKSPNVRSRVDKRQKRSDNNHTGLQYDPISGRMVPIQSSTTSESSNREAKVYSHKAVDCPLGTKVKSKFAHNPNLAEDEPFQPGNTGLSPEAPSSSQSTVDCPPGSEIDAVFTSTPASQDAQGRAQAQETERKPYVNTDCPPGSELETFFVSESIPSAKTQSGTSGVNGNTDKLNLDAGVTAGNDMECSPGSELEAKFISDPTSRSVQCSRSALATQTPNKQIGISIDCPPGNELDTKLSSELAGLGLESAGPVHQTTNTAPTADPQASLECSPGSEIEAHLLESSSQVSAQSGAQTSIDCPPGNELEPKFIYNSASIEKMRSQPALRSSLGTSKMTKNIVDCTPGNELEAKFITEMASAEGPNENEDLSALSDTDIRSHCAPLKPKVQASPLDFGPSEGNISDFILQSQKLPTEKGEQPAASISPKFHILAFDTSTSQVIAAQADSFFGVDEEDNRPSKILSQLHNPAKFLPYFEKMQEGGYEIATGGGNILVFRKSQPTPCHTLSNTATDQQPVVHTKIARHLRHDSTDPAAKYAGAPWQSTTEPRSKTGSFSSEPESTTKSKSSFRKTGRRMLVAGTATAATCYAIGVMIEFFRTGGKDGRGIDGFTVFESDRRRRE